MSDIIIEKDELKEKIKNDLKIVSELDNINDETEEKLKAILKDSEYGRTCIQVDRKDNK